MLNLSIPHSRLLETAALACALVVSACTKDGTQDQNLGTQQPGVLATPAAEDPPPEDVSPSAVPRPPDDEQHPDMKEHAGMKGHESMLNDGGHPH